MSGSQLLVELVVVLGTAAVVTLLFQAARLPVVLGYITAGMVVGPHVPVPLIADPHLVHALSELGVVLLMFALGLELRLSTLAKVGIGAGLTALFEVAATLTIGALVARALGFSSTEAVFAGACLGISSTMLVAQAFGQLGWKGGFTDLVFAILVFEDLIAVVLLAVLTGLATGAGLGPMALLVMLGKLLGFLVGVLAIGLVVVPRLVRALLARGRGEATRVVALALCAGAAALGDHLGFPVALGAFLAGLVIAESGHGHDVLLLVAPFRDLFAMIFFVAIGMTVVPADVVAELPTILAFTAVVLVVKPAAIALGGLATGRGLGTSVRAGLSLAQNGELSFVIAALGASHGVARPSLLAIAVGVVCLTTLSWALTIRRSDGLAAAIAAGLPGRLATFVSFYESWIGRLGATDTAWRRVRGPVAVLVVDTAVVIAVAIGGAVVAARADLPDPLRGRTGAAVIALATILVAAPFALGVVRRLTRIARALAELVIPPGAAVDLGRAPRHALAIVLELALAGAVITVVIAAIQPFVGGGAIALAVAFAVPLALAYRAIVDFDQHVRAGSELVLELLRQPTSTPPLAALEGALPGFGDTRTVRLPDGAPAVGRSLADLDLRARTGATVLAIARADGGFASPEPHEALRAGDVLALTGGDDAIAAAQHALLGEPSTAAETL